MLHKGYCVNKHVNIFLIIIQLKLQKQCCLYFLKSIENDFVHGNQEKIVKKLYMQKIQR